MDGRHRYLARRLAVLLHEDASTIEKAFNETEGVERVELFFSGLCKKLIWFRQAADNGGKKSEQSAAVLFVTNGEEARFSGRAVYFIHVGTGVITEKNIDEVVVSGCISRNG